MKAASFWLHAGKLRLSDYMQESCVFLITCSPWYNLSGWLGVKHQLLTSGYMQESRVFLVTCRKAASFWLCAGKLASFWLHAGKPCLSGHMQESRVFLVTCWEAMSFWLHAGKPCLSGYMLESYVFLVTCRKAVSSVHMGRSGETGVGFWERVVGLGGGGVRRVVIEWDVVGCVSREQV